MESIGKIIGKPSEILDRINEEMVKEEVKGNGKESQSLINQVDNKDSETEEIRKQLRQLIKERKVSQADVAHSIGVGNATLSQWLNNIYLGNISKITGQIKSYLSLQTEREESPKYEFRFVMTSVAKKVFEIARLCHKNNEIGVVYGEAGLGKTCAVKEYARLNTDVILINACPGWTRRTLMKKIHIKLGYCGGKYVDDMVGESVNKLMNSGRLIIVDEAENLDSDILNSLRRIHDEAGVGILLVGMPSLLSNLKGKKRDYQQLYSRVSRAYNLKPIQMTDVELMCNDKELCRFFYEACQGNARRLSHLLPETLRVSKGNVVTPEAIQKATQILLI
jgi:hypothetical protein